MAFNRKRLKPSMEKPTRGEEYQVSLAHEHEHLVIYIDTQVKQILSKDGDHTDILIALHACDTATDDALGKAISANANLVITAPCCHKQIRQQLKGKEQENPILKYGIFKERQFEMVTDTIRALILEKNQYSTKVFEFISNEHTRKNVMLVGQKSNKKPDTEAIAKKIDDLKKEYHVESHYLETLV